MFPPARPKVAEEFTSGSRVPFARSYRRTVCRLETGQSSSYPCAFSRISVSLWRRWWWRLGLLRICLIFVSKYVCICSIPSWTLDFLSAILRSPLPPENLVSVTFLDGTSKASFARSVKLRSAEEAIRASVRYREQDFPGLASATRRGDAPFPGPCRSP